MLSFFAPRNRKMWKRNGAARIKPRGKAHTAHRRKNFVGMTEKTQNILRQHQSKLRQAANALMEKEELSENAIVLAWKE